MKGFILFVSKLKAFFSGSSYLPSSFPSCASRGGQLEERSLADPIVHGFQPHSGGGRASGTHRSGKDATGTKDQSLQQAAMCHGCPCLNRWHRKMRPGHEAYRPTLQRGIAWQALVLQATE